MKSWLLVGIQFVCLVGIGLTGPLIAGGPWIVLQVAGGALGVWALWTMHPARLNVLPDLRVDARLLQNGPYAFVRHPMYSGLIVLTLAMLAADFSWLRLLFWVGLVVNFDVKLRYEETFLQARFADYNAYAQKTARLIPYVY